MSKIATMLSFDQCPHCLPRPRVQVCSSQACEKQKNQDTLVRQLEDLHMQVTVNDHYYRCPACGTYYRFESAFSGTIDYYDLRLVRITIFEALNAFRSPHQTSGDFSKAWQEAKASGLWRVKSIRSLLKSTDSRAREFAAETLADFYKQHNKADQVRTLLQHPAAEIRLGTLWSYAEIPWRSYMLDSPSAHTYHGLFDFKPFGKVSSVINTIFSLLCDPDQRIRIIASNFVSKSFLGKSQELYKKLHRLPIAQWSAELKSLLINSNYPGTDHQSFTELCNFLMDADEAIRRSALIRIYDYYSETDIPIYIDFITTLSQTHPTDQTKWFLEHPYAGLENSDDDYD